jgi:hypothetical protein
MNARCRWVGALLVALAGCSTQSEKSYSCAAPDENHLGPDGMPDPCHEQDADAGPCAAGTYAHRGALWEAPLLLWIGPEDQAPACPLGSGSVAYEGRTDLVAPNACEACTCEPPTGSCALPSTLDVQADVCGPQGKPPISWNAPSPWDGQCDGSTQIPSGKAYSLKIGALTMKENGCAPGPTIPAKVISLRWDTFARGCDFSSPMGPIERSNCLRDDVASGFGWCILQKGDNDCPTDPENIYTERHVFYNGVQDDRQCSPCTCGAPTGSACTATVSIYTDAAPQCTATAVPGVVISSVSTTCVDIQLPGQALGSKSAGSTTYHPGTCPAMGGDASGSAVKTSPVTFCCRP